MKRLYISNAFSLNMLDREAQKFALDRRVPVPLEDPVSYLAWREEYNPEVVIESIVDHEDTAALFSVLLRRDVRMERRSIQLGKDDVALIGQYTGPRLSFGATELPAGAAIAWWLV